MTKAILIVLAVLVAATAYARTFTQTEASVQDLVVCIGKTSSDPTFIVKYRTLDTNGVFVREVPFSDVWPQLTGTQQTQIRNVINAVFNAVHTAESIPTPTPAQ